METEPETRGWEDDGRGYEDSRSRSPRRDGHGNGDMRARSASPDDRDRMDSRGPPPSQPPEEDEEAARNTGTNLFVTGIHPRLGEEDIQRLFSKYGDVEKCNIMRDPHTRESRGFGFVNMVSAQQADAAREGLQGEVYEGRTLSIEKARRSRPRTPTPGKYFGPPKREDFRRGPPRGRYGDRYEDRRGGYGRRDEPYSYRGTRDRDYDRGYYGRRERYDDRPPVDRYSSSRDERYGGRGPPAARGGGGGGRDYYDRNAAPSSYADAPAPRASGGSYDDRGADDRYSRR